MNSDVFDRLAPNNAPESWLAVIDPGRKDYVVHVARSQEELDIWKLKKEWINWIRLGHDIVALKDSPSLLVHYDHGLYGGGYQHSTPAHLTARKNWFLRYRDILSNHLSNPLPAFVHFFERRSADDLFCTMRSTKSGPFPFPKDAEWPSCGHCRQKMAFIGTLDFRNYHSLGKARLPKGSLVLHGCDQCTIPCSDDESTSLIWITPEQQIQMRSAEDANQESIEVGVAWETIEFPTPAFVARSISDDPGFLNEGNIYQNFACPLTKVGGHVRWIQNDDTPVDQNGNPMHYIGQFIEPRDVELGDSGIVYLFYDSETRKTSSVLQYY